MQETVGAGNARARMPEGVREPEALDDAVGERDVAPQLPMVAR